MHLHKRDREREIEYLCKMRRWKTIWQREGRERLKKTEEEAEVVEETKLRRCEVRGEAEALVMRQCQLCNSRQGSLSELFETVPCTFGEIREKKFLDWESEGTRGPMLMYVWGVRVKCFLFIYFFVKIKKTNDKLRLFTSFRPEKL